MRDALITALLVLSTATAALAHPGSGIVVDRRGYVYFVDTGSGAWQIDPAGKLARAGGPRFHWMTIEEGVRPAGALLPSIPGGEITAVGSNPTLLLSSDVPIAADRDGTLFYPELGRIVAFTRTGAKSVRAVLPGAPKWINGLALGADGSLYYTEDKSIRKVDRRGVVSTVAMNVAVPGCAAIPDAEPPYLRGLAIAPDNTIFVAASGCGAVLKVTPRGAVTTVLRTSSPWSPTAVAVSPSGVYVLEYLHTATEDRQAWVPRVRKILPDGRVVSVAAVKR